MDSTESGSPGGNREIRGLPAEHDHLRSEEDDLLAELAEQVDLLTGLDPAAAVGPARDIAEGLSRALDGEER